MIPPQCDCGHKHCSINAQREHAEKTAKAIEGAISCLVTTRARLVHFGKSTCEIDAVLHECGVEIQE